MKKLLASLLISVSFIAALSSPAGASAETLGTCLVDSLTGKERKQLAKWIYFAIAAHPEIRPYSNIDSGNRESTDKYIGGLMTRLLAENCASELKAAQKADPLAVERAFELVGKVAMQELMNDQSVMAAITNYAKYVDESKIKSLFAE